jgi:hypothetical protein
LVPRQGTLVPSSHWSQRSPQPPVRASRWRQCKASLKAEAPMAGLIGASSYELCALRDGPRKVGCDPSVRPPPQQQRGSKSESIRPLTLQPRNMKTQYGGKSSMLAVLALFGWRRRKVSYAVSHERFPRTPPVRKRSLLRLLKAEIFDFPRCSRSRGHAYQ